MKDGKQRQEAVGAFEGLDATSVTDAEDAIAKRRVQRKQKPLFDLQPEADFAFDELTEWYLPIEKDRIASEEISETYLKSKK